METTSEAYITEKILRRYDIEEIETPEIFLGTLSKLYKEFVNDFSQKRQSRLSSKNPYQASQHYTLEVNKPFRKKQRRLLQSLLSSYECDQLLSLFTDCVDDFVIDLSEELEKLQGKSKLLRIICFNEAYSTLINAANEIERIVLPLMIQSQQSCRFIHKSVFQKILMKDNEDLVEYAHSDDLRRAEIAEFISIEQQVSEEYQEPNECPSEDSVSDSEELLHSMSLDELVSYINSSPHDCSPKRTKKKRRKVKGKEADEEVENLKITLNSMSLSERKLKPCISQNYLSKLRSLIAGKSN